MTAVEGLVGGLPRLWTILAGCITVDLLDDLVPLVLSTLEELVPYYQARLNELSASERKLVVALCRAETLGSRTGRTVGELALAAGVPEGSAPKLLKRLEDASWVVPTKPPGTDRRATWYEIREPLLRYHVVYRRQAGEPLALIVSFLRAWFSPSERRQHLAGIVASSTTESYIFASLRDVPAGSDALYTTAEPVDLLTGARQWLAGDRGGSTTVRSQAAAIVAEAVALVALGRLDAVEATLAARLEQIAVPHRDVVEHIARAAIDAARLSSSSGGARADLTARQATVQRGLDAAVGPAAQGQREDEMALALIAHGWRGVAGDDEGAYRKLLMLLDRTGRLDEASPALRLAVEAEVAYFGCLAGHRPRELVRMRRVLEEREHLLGSDNPDTLMSRSNVAYETAAAGDHTRARDLFAALVDDHARILGPDHPDTLASRSNVAYETGAAGDHARARDLHAAVIDGRTRIHGPDHPDTLISRHNHADQTGAAGNHARARDLYLELIEDRAHILGPDHPDTLTTRREHAYQTGAAGDHARAHDLFAALIDDHIGFLGPNHPHTLDVQGVALAFIQDRAARREAALSLLSRPCPEPVEAHARRVLDDLFAEPGPHHHALQQDRAALPHMLAASRPGPGLVALASQAGSTADVAEALVGATGDTPAKLSTLTTAIVEALGRTTWTRSELVAWLEAWTSALIDRPAAEVPRSMLDVVRREVDGDPTARPSLPPELRSILPPLRLEEDAD